MAVALGLVGVTIGEFVAVHGAPITAGQKVCTTILPPARRDAFIARCTAGRADGYVISLFGIHVAKICRENIATSLVQG